MSDTNYIGSIVKIVETPTQTSLKNTIPLTKFRVQFPQFRNTIIVCLVCWGNLARDVVRYYKINDYIIIEGYLSTYIEDTNINKKLKQLKVTVLRIYPFMLMYNSNEG
jgi:single-stranded DNA-binding protein